MTLALRMTHFARSPVIAESYRHPIVFALVLQVVIAVLSMLMLDGGQLAKVCGVAMAGFWIGGFVIIGRRPFNPTASDLLYFRIGFVAVLAACFTAQSFLVG